MMLVVGYSFRSILLFLFLVVSVGLSFSQQWPQVLLPNLSIGVWSITENYDKGYVLGGMYTETGAASWGIAIKANINGEVLWYKSLGEPNDGTSVKDINPTDDGGYILTGGTKKFHPNSIGDSFIMKLNACGEVEWSRIYLTDNEGDYGIGISEVPDGYVALIGGYGYDSQNQRIWLFKLDDGGDLVWQQYYAQSDTSIIGEWAYDMKVTSENEYILSGYCLYPEPGKRSLYEYNVPQS